jgi:hypothetical protein
MSSTAARSPAMAPILLAAARGLDGLGDGGEGLVPARGLQLAVLADIGPVEALASCRPSQMKRVLSEIHSSFTPR